MAVPLTWCEAILSTTEGLVEALDCCPGAADYLVHVMGSHRDFARMAKERQAAAFAEAAVESAGVERYRLPRWTR